MENGNRVLDERRPPGPDDRLRVLFINDTSRNGGPGRTLLDILKFLDPARIHRAVLIPREGIVSRRLLDGKVAEELFFEPDLIENLVEPLSRAMERRDFDAPLPLKALRAAANILRAATGVVRLLRRVRDDRAELGFCNGTSANFVGGAIAIFTKVPVIWHVFYPSVAPVLRPLHRWLAARPNVRAILCVSRAVEGQFAHCGDKVRVIHDALDIAEFDAEATAPVLRRELGLAQDVVIFGSHGRIVRRKGFIELIRAARLVVDRLTAEERAKCLFVVLGDTPQDTRSDHAEECETLMRSLGLADNFRFLGFRADVHPYVADFDVAVVPSVYVDPLPRAVMEAMAMSKPVVAFANGGIAEMFTDGVDGRLVRGAPPDIEGLAAACLDYFRDADARLRHGAAARRRVEQDFDAAQHGRILQDVMLQIGADQRGRRSKI